MNKSDWPPYKVDALRNNIQSVFKNKDITKLNKPTYTFITLYMGFIAHYDLQGFQSTYKDLRDFVKRLQTSEYSSDKNYNMTQVDYYLTNYFLNQNKDYYISVSEGIKAIVRIARHWESSINTDLNHLEKTSQIAYALKLLKHHQVGIEDIKEVYTNA